MDDVPTNLFNYFDSVQPHLPTPWGARSWAFDNGTFSLADIDTVLHKICGADSTLFRVYSRGWLAQDAPSFNTLTALMYQLPAFLILSRTLYLIMRPLKQPRIICDLMAGILLGPSVFDQTFISKYILGLEYNLTVRSLGAYGLIYHFFLTGVKTDPAMVRQSGREAIWVGICSAILPLAVTLGILYLFGDFIPAAIARGKYLFFLAALASVTAFPVLGEMLAELGILNTELGRLGMSSSMISCVFGWLFMALFTAMHQYDRALGAAVYSGIALVAMVVFIVGVMGPLMRWIVKKTPKEGQVREEYIALILISVTVLGLISEAIGASLVDGPLLLGLMVPDGPPLGSALVRRLELIVSELMMPLFFFAVGNSIWYVWEVDFWVQWFPTILIIALAYGTKVVATTFAAMYCNISFNNAIVLGLIMSFRGVVEVIVLYQFKIGSLLESEGFSILMLMVLLSTTVSVPLVSTLYNPLGSNHRWGGRTIQHLRTHAELLITVVVHNEGPVPCELKLIEASSAIDEGPMSVYLLHLVDLGGRINSSLIAHRNRRGFINPSGMDRLLNAFINYETEKKGRVTMVPFTSIAPYSSMHQDICGLASEKRTAIIIVPYPRKDPTAEDSVSDYAIRKAVPNILELASCSVGILIHPRLSNYVVPSPSKFQYNVGLLFWGGADDREALSYASRMASHSGVTLYVTRFVPAVDMRTKLERQLDDHLVECFKISHSNNPRLLFRDVLAKDSEETLAVIRNIDIYFDLIIAGRRQGQNSCLSESLLEWSDSPELGIVGDLLSAPDFKQADCILIVQQHG